MKNKIISIAIIVVVIGLVVISSLIKTTDNQTMKEETREEIMKKASLESNSITDSEKKYFIDINVDKYLEYYKESEKKIILIARHSCQYCQIAEPILQKLAKEYQLDIYYLNTEEVNKEDQEKFINSNELFQSNFGTPFLVIVKQGKIIEHVAGAVDTNHYLQAFKKSGIIQ